MTHIVPGVLAASKGGSLISWQSSINFSRPSPATYWDGTTFTRYATGERRILDDGSIFVEGHRATIAGHSQLNANWEAPADELQNIDSPMGTLSGSTITTVPNLTAPHDGSTFNNMDIVHVSCWLRGDVNGSVMLGADPYAANTDVLVNYTPDWVRYDVNIVQTQVLTFVTLRNNTSQYYADGFQIELATFASSLIENNSSVTGAREADIIQTIGAIPTTMQSGAWTIDITPSFSSTQNSEVMYIMDQDISSLKLNINMVELEGIGGGVVSAPLTWDAGQTITIVVDSVSGSMEISGASTGNGVVTGSPWTWPDAQMWIGSLSGGFNSFFGAISEPQIHTVI